jgi:hypothetical protein
MASSCIGYVFRFNLNVSHVIGDVRSTSVVLVLLTSPICKLLY